MLLSSAKSLSCLSMSSARHPGTALPRKRLTTTNHHQESSKRARTDSVTAAETPGRAVTHEQRQTRTRSIEDSLSDSDSRDELSDCDEIKDADEESHQSTSEDEAAQ